VSFSSNVKLAFTDSTQALSTAGLCLIIPEVYCGAGRRRAFIPIEKALMGLKINFATQPLYVVAI
jgi:hypothetical protein